MKKNKFKSSLIITSLALATFLSSCSKNEYLDNASIDGDLIEVKSLVSSLGFDTVGIKFDDDKIIVEGDILLYKSKLSKSTPRQASGFNGPLLIDNSTVKYYIPSNITDGDAIVSALGEYGALMVNRLVAPNGTPIGLPEFIFNFVRVYSENEATVVFRTYYSQNLGEYGYADFPTRLPGLGSPYLPNPRLKTGKYISINLNAWNNVGWSQKKFFIAHEFGHAIGLRHTNWKSGESEYVNFNGVSIGAYTVPGTGNGSTNPDPNSVFNSGSGTTPFVWNGFTNHDKLAISYVAAGL